jgi:hypothetical protein
VLEYEHVGLEASRLPPVGCRVEQGGQYSSTLTAYKGNQCRYLSGAISGCIAEV